MIFKNPVSTDIPNLWKLWEEGFGDSIDFFNTFLKHGYSWKRCRFAEENGKAVSALYIFDCYLENKKIAYIYAVATAKEERGKGYCKALFSDTHNFLKENGYCGALLVPSSKELFAFYEKIGYKTATYADTVKVYADKNGSVELRQIDKEEYRQLRREFLPDGAVIQEEENLDFLNALEQFYVADRVLLAAHIKDNTLYAQEFLGEKELLPFIVSSLSAEKGVFKTVGKSAPFSMYYPFYEDSPKPSWFGLAFD